MNIPLISGVDLPLTDLMKASTRSLHTEAEKTGVVSNIIRQRVTMRDYLNFIQNLIEVYTTLESETAWLKHHDSLKKFFNSALYRKTQLEHDYAQLLSLNAPNHDGLIHAETRLYSDHIAHSQKHAPSAMLAHIYVRYFGDLNGGQVLRRLLTSSLGLTDQYLSFYAFPEIQDIRKFTLEFREALNAVIVTDTERTIAKQAAIEAFKFNIALSKACQS